MLLIFEISSHYLNIPILNEFGACTDYWTIHSLVNTAAVLKDTITPECAPKFLNAILTVLL